MNREDQMKSDLDERLRKAIETSENAAADYRRAINEATKAMERLESDGGHYTVGRRWPEREVKKTP